MNNTQPDTTEYTDTPAPQAMVTPPEILSSLKLAAVSQTLMQSVDAEHNTEDLSDIVAGMQGALNDLRNVLSHNRGDSITSEAIVKPIPDTI